MRAHLGHTCFSFVDRNCGIVDSLQLKVQTIHFFCQTGSWRWRWDYCDAIRRYQNSFDTSASIKDGKLVMHISTMSSTVHPSKIMHPKDDTCRTGTDSSCIVSSCMEICNESFCSPAFQNRMANREASNL